MSIIKGSEKVVNPLQQSALYKKGLCDYVVNVASGCLHGCTFCYVPSTPVIRARPTQLREQGIKDPQMDWGKYLLIREEVPEKLERLLSRKQVWHETSAGRGVVLLCSGTDPYQNEQVATITRQAIKILLKYNKRIRVLTRSPLWLKDLELLSHPDVTVGMSIPLLDDDFSRQMEPNAPLPTERYKTLLKASKQGCRVYVAVAPTPPQMKVEHFTRTLEQLMSVNPEVIFWEPINARGSNGKRMAAAGLEFVHSIMDKQSWAANFLQQWADIEVAANNVGCIDRLHIWADSELIGFVKRSTLDYWWYRPTVERWQGIPYEHVENTPPRPHLQNDMQILLATQLAEQQEFQGNA